MPTITGTLVPPVLASAPSNPTRGQMYYDSTQDILYYWNGTQWVSTQSTVGTIYDSDYVGTVKAFSGSTIPTNWMLADGRALSRTVYSDLFAAIGTLYGAGDGSTTFNIPDLRGRMLVGSGTGTGLTNRVLGTNGGEEAHLLSVAEMPSHNHGGATGTGTSGNTDTDHYHAFNVNSGTVSSDHTHSLGNVWGSSGSGNVQGGSGVDSILWYQNVTSGISANHVHNVAGNTNWQSQQYATNNHNHSVPALGISAQGGGTTHNTMPPWCAVGLIIKVAGAQINSGGALQGATGPRGASWYSYTGTGTPPGTFGTSAQNGDFAIRSSDGEIFQYANGVWVDQSYSLKGGVTMAARAYRSASYAIPVGWIKVPLDTLDFDTSGMWNAANSRFIAPTAGYYSVSGGLSVTASSGNYIQIGIYKNGAAIGDQEGAGSGTGMSPVMSVSDLVYLNAGDYVELFAWANATGFTTSSQGHSGFLAASLVGSLPAVMGPASVARMYRSAAYTLVSGSNAILPLDTASFDPNANFSTAGNRYICPATGYYNVQAGLAMTSTASGQSLQCLVYKNGVVYTVGDSFISTASGQTMEGTAGDIIQCNAGDYLQVGYFSSVALSVLTTQTNTYFAITQVDKAGVQGPRGAGWYSYTGSGTPGATAIPGTQNGDFCIRSSDGEVYQMVSGAWVDQLYAIKGTGGGGGGGTGSATTTALAAKAYRNAAFTTGAAGWTKIPLDTASYDTSGLFQPGNSRLVATSAGYYQINASVAVNAAATQGFLCSVYKNGAELSRGDRTITGGAAGVLNVTASDIVQLSAGDYLELWCWDATGSHSLEVIGAAENFLSMSLVTSLSTTAAPVSAARMYRNTAYTTAAAATTKMPFDTVGYDPGGNLQIANSRYICPASGYYQVSGQVQVTQSASSDTLILWIAVNGANRTQGNRLLPGAQVTAAVVSDIVQCNAGDYIELFYYTQTADPAGVGVTTNYLSVIQVGQQTQLASGLTTGAVAARAYRNAAMSLGGASTYTKIPLDTVQYDTAGIVQTANGRIQIQTAGYYEIEASAALAGTNVPAAGTNTVFLANIFVNGSVRTEGQRETNVDASGWMTALVSDTIQLNAGDYVELWAYSNVASPAVAGSTGGIRNFLSVSMVSALPSSPAVTTATRARASAAAALPAGAWTTIPIDTKDADPGNNFNTATRRYVCPVTGFYQINGQYDIVPTVGNATLGIRLYKNGATEASIGDYIIDASSNAHNTVQVSDILSLNAGDTIELQGFCSGANSAGFSSPAYNYLSVVQVGAAAQIQSGLTTGAVAARAQRAATLSVSGWTRVPIDTVIHDTSGMVSIANGRIQILIAGYYHINASGFISAAASGTTYAGIQPYKNGSSVGMGQGGLLQFTAAASGQEQYTYGDTVQCNAGDYIELYAYSNPAATFQNGWISVSMAAALPAAVGPTTPARAYRGTALTTTAATFTKVAVDTISADPGGNFSTANGRYVVPATGSYQVNGQVAFSPPTNGQSNNILALIYKNGAAVSRGIQAVITSNGTNGLGAPVGDVIQCNAGDYLELYVWTTNALPLEINAAENYLSVTQVGNTVAAPAATACARAYRTAALALAASAATKVPLDTLDFDTSGMYNGANGRLVAPVAGYYHVSGQAILSATGNTNQTIDVMVYVNGAQRTSGSSLGQTESLGWARVNVSDTVKLNAGDYVELFVYTANALNLYVGAPSLYNFLSMALLTPLSGTAGPTTAARAYRNAAFTPGGSGWQKIPVDTVSSDPAACFTLASGRYVCPATGAYKVDGGVNITNTGAGQTFQCGIYKNGAMVAQGNAAYNLNNGQSAILTASDTIQCNAGDYLELWAYFQSAMPLGVSTATNFLGVTQVDKGMTLTTAGGDLSGNYPNPTVATRLKPVTISANYTANPWDYVICNQPTIGVTLPLNPPDGCQVAICSYQTAAGSHAVSGNGRSIWRLGAPATTKTITGAVTVVWEYNSTNNDWRVVSDSAITQIATLSASYLTGAWPQSCTFTAPFKCDAMITMTASCWATAAGLTGLALQFDGTSQAPYADHYANETSSHKQFATTVYMRGVAAGSHTLTCAAGYGNVGSDGNDRCMFAVTMVPVN